MPAKRPSQSQPSVAQEMARNCFGMRARRLNRLVTRIYDEALRPHGVTAAQLNILVGIGVAGPVPAVALGRTLDLEKSTLSRNLERLVESGWVASSRDLVLTAEGQRILQRVLPAWESAQEHIRKRLGGAAIPTLDAMAKKMLRA